MTQDLSARLRDMLNDELLRDTVQVSESDLSLEEMRSFLQVRLLPLLSSLLEEREREIVAYLRGEDLEAVARQIENGWHRK